MPMTLDPDPLTVYPEPDTDDEPWRVPDGRMCWLVQRDGRSVCLAHPNGSRRCDFASVADVRRWWALAIAAVVLFAVAVAWWR